MPDPLSASAGVVGITVPALHFTRLLLDDVKTVLDAPKVIQRLRDDLVAVEKAYGSMKSIPQADWATIGSNIATQAQAAVTSCEELCISQHKDLQRWTKHSAEGGLSKRDRMIVGFFKERQLRAMSDELQATKLTFTSVVSLATLHSTFRSGKASEDTTKAVVVAADAIQANTRTIDDKLASIEDSLEILRIKDVGPNEDVDDRTNAIRHLEQTSPQLDKARKLLNEVLGKTSEESIKKDVKLPDHSVNINFTGMNYQGMQLGVSYAPITFGGKATP